MGFPNSIHGMQRTARTTRSPWNQLCPSYIHGEHGSDAVPGLNNTILINVINTDGAQAGPVLGAVLIKIKIIYIIIYIIVIYYSTCLY